MKFHFENPCTGDRTGYQKDAIESVGGAPTGETNKPVVPKTENYLKIAI